jgi:hypothetical protein
MRHLVNVADTAPVFCKDCKWYEQNGTSAALCKAPESFTDKLDLVSGEQVKKQEHPYCASHRLYPSGQVSIVVCGSEGRWFEPK